LGRHQRADDDAPEVPTDPAAELIAHPEPARPEPASAEPASPEPPALREPVARVESIPRSGRRRRGAAQSLSVAELRARLTDAAGADRTDGPAAADFPAPADSSDPANSSDPADSSDPIASDAYAGRRRRIEADDSPAGPAQRQGARRRLLPLLAAAAAVFLIAAGAAVAHLVLASPSGTPTAAGTHLQLADPTPSGTSDGRVSRDKRQALDSSTGADSTDASTAGSPDGGTAAQTDGTSPLSAAGDGGSTLATSTAPPMTTETVTAIPPPPAPVWVYPTVGGNMTSCFCERWGAFHDGIDLDPPLGTPIFAVGDGTVVFAGPVSGYGIGIYIQHSNGDVSFYGHEAIYYVHTGDVVTAGQKIALVGNEGNSTGPHLHFGVYQGWQSIANIGTAIDPVPWLAARGVATPPYNPNG
jgi:murein DD-endopeptidase MepM/ murein hydrolase activator NlpD